MHCLSEPYCLVLSDRRLYLMPSPEPEKIKSGGEWGAYLASGKGAIFVDFAGGKNCHRRQFGGGKSQSIAKAVGIRSGFFPSVLDVTAGFGADAFVL
ncbi:MAG: class I SAM-dependent methyltransferase, partial [Pseudomonadales bacterium]|nr:class I SAM-dependent methyltransferase [Pseudomonadales bacterium]